MRRMYATILGMVVLFAILYVPIAVQASALSTGTPAIPPQKPYVIWGYSFNMTGGPSNGSKIVLTNENTTKVLTIFANSTGYYKYDLANMVGGYQAGNIINITANTTYFIGWNETNVTGSGGKWLNVTLNKEIFYPYKLCGYVKYSTGIAVPNANMTITNKKTSQVIQMDSNNAGYYEIELSTMPKGYHIGEIYNATANDTKHNAYNESALTSKASKWLNVTFITAFSIYLDHVTIDPPSATLAPTMTQDFKAKSYNNIGNEILSGVTYSWSLSGSIGTISPTTGNLTTLTATAVGSGTVTVTVTFNSVSKTNQSSVLVKLPTNPIHHVVVNPPSVSVLVSTSMAFSATAYDEFGAELSTGVVFTWSVTGGIGTLNTTTGQSTTLTASSSKGSGSVDVTGTYFGDIKTNSSSVTITDIQPALDHVSISPDTVSINMTTSVNFTATAYDQNGNVLLNGVSFSWEVKGGIGSLNISTGPLVAFTAGSAVGSGNITVTATCGSDTALDNALVTVINGNGNGNGTGDGNKTGDKILGLDSWMFYSLIGIITAIIIAALLIALLARKKKKQDESRQFALPYPQQHYLQQYMNQPGFSQQYPQYPGYQQQYGQQDQQQYK